MAINMSGQESKQRYFDIVTFSNQKISFDMSVADSSDMGISIKPMITENSKITIEINTGLDSGTQQSDIVTMTSDKFTSLARIKSDSSWININAVGRVVSNI